jgi:SAM-dependent methyltransferase
MSANQEMIDYWNGARGLRWVIEQEMRDRALLPFGDAALAAADARPGETVLDVGCGCGASSLALAAQVAPSGRVTGVDVSAPMLARARERAAGLANLDFLEADAAAHAFSGVDLIHSRFGVMFFSDPTQAFANMRAGMARGGRLAFICWRTLAENPWLALPFSAIARVLPMLPSVDPTAPGPLSLGDPERVRRVLGDAGWTDVKLTPYDHPVPLGDGQGLDAAVADSMTVGPTGRVINASDEDARRTAHAVIRDALAPHLVGGGVELGGGAWVVTARA